MEYLISTARNVLITACEENGETIKDNSNITTEPLIEMILTTYEKHMALVDGNIINRKELKTHRIGLSINAIESLVTQLEEWLEEAKIIQERLKEKINA